MWGIGKRLIIQMLSLARSFAVVMTVLCWGFNGDAENKLTWGEGVLFFSSEIILSF